MSVLALVTQYTNVTMSVGILKVYKIVSLTYFSPHKEGSEKKITIQ